MDSPLEGHILVRHMLAAALFAAAGGSLYLLLLGRLFAFLPRRSTKLPAMAAAILLLVLAPTAFGAWTGFTLWALIPAGVLTVLLLGEWRQAGHRRRTRGMSPVRSWDERRSLARPLTTTALDVLRYTLDLPAWRGPAFRVVHLSDLHVGRALPAEYYDRVIRAVTAERPDLVFVTGDFVSRSTDVDLLPPVLRALQARLGVFAVLGNHDFWAGEGPVAEAVASSGVELLRDESREVNMGPEQTLVVRGVEAPWQRRKLRPMPAPATGPVFVLSHTPDNVYELDRQGAAAVFSGHYHAGQFRIPWFGPLMLPSVHGRRFVHGHFVVGGTHLFVSAGIGVGKPSLRLYCPPDIFVVDIRPGAA